jgi:hypothetical protein
MKKCYLNDFLGNMFGNGMALDLSSLAESIAVLDGQSRKLLRGAGSMNTGELAELNELSSGIEYFLGCLSSQRVFERTITPLSFAN